MDLDAFWSPYRGAVSLTFDDGTANQLRKAIPPMDRLGLRGTFYLVPKERDWKKRYAPWTAVARSGHEIGNHTLSHACAGNFGGVAQGGLEDMTVQEIESDVLAAQERLVQIAPDQTRWTFCYPCYCTFVGRAETRQSYVPIVARHFLAGRAGGEYGFANHPAAVDLSCAWGLATERMSGFEMIGLVEELTSRGQWVILVFHEIDGSRLTVGSHEFHMLLNYLHRRRDVIWTAPVVEVAQKIAEFQAKRGAHATRGGAPETDA